MGNRSLASRLSRLSGRRRLAGVLAATLIATLATGCGGGHSTAPASTSGSSGAADAASIAWPAPPPDRVIGLVRAAGLVPETAERLQYHVHTHLDVYIDGQKRTVPAGIGIVTTDPGVHRGQFAGQPTFGGITGCDQPCISPLHTHDVTGIIHTESATEVDNTLGQLFKEWDVNLGPDCMSQYCAPRTPIAVYVDGSPVPLADAPAVALSDQREIAIIIGRPPARIPGRT